MKQVLRHGIVRDRRAAVVVLVCAAAALPYLPASNDYFVRDDFGVVQLLAAKPASYFPRWFVTSWMDEIWGFVPDEVRPFMALSYQLTALPGPGSTWAHHALNIALHAANALLVFAMGRRLAGLRVDASAFAALVFALLPVCAESVVWITGRVDSMPAAFYVGALLLYARWRDHAGRPLLYWASVGVYLLALFTKQNAITLPAMIVAFDALAPARPRPIAKRAAAYAPFAALTAGYLALRYVLFGQAAREEQLRTDMLAAFPGMVMRHLADVVAGNRSAEAALVWSLVALAVVLAIAARGSSERRNAARTVVLFGPVWWLLGVAPVVVAGYESPRHVYLAAMGWAIVLGGAFQSVAGVVDRRWWRTAAAVLALVVALAYGARLLDVVAEWRETADVSARAVRLVEETALAAPPGTLLIVGVPRRSWEWALPFAARPPFSGVDATARHHVISPWTLHCCRVQWFDETRRALASWSEGEGRDSVVLIRVDAGSAATLSALQSPGLPVVARLLLDLDRHDHLDGTLQRLIESVR